MIAAIAIATGMLAGYLSGGGLAGIAGIRLRFEWAILAAFVIQGIARGRLLGASASSKALVVWVLISTLLVLLLGLNHKKPGALVAALGVLLNVDVVMINLGMPVSVDALQASANLASSGGFYHLAGPSSVAHWAGDAMSLWAFGHQQLLSAGDVLLVVGVAVLIAASMLEADSRVDLPAMAVEK